MKMADYLHNCGVDPIFIDNASTYQPLLDYYKNCKYETVLLDHNFGHTVIWDAGILFKLGIDDEYIVTDSDLDLTGVPKDFLDVLRRGLDKYPQYEKCALSLRIDDLPNIEFSNFVRKTEGGYWTRPLDDMYFDAATDTTFSLYRTRLKSFNSIRTNIPYCARHVPWYYTDMNNISDDEKYYFKNIKTSTYYSHFIANSK